MEASFHYHGPVTAVDNRECVTCNARSTKKCPTHGGFQEGCAHCAATRGAPCQAHWGLKAALDAHKPNVSEDAMDAYEDASERVTKVATTSKDATIFADFRVSYDERAKLYEYLVTARTH